MVAAAMTTLAAARPVLAMARRSGQPARRRAALRVVRANPNSAKDAAQDAAQDAMKEVEKVADYPEYPPASREAPAAQPEVVRPHPPGVPTTAVSGPEDLVGFKATPEIINGRLAMLGFVAALGAELAYGTPVLTQLAIAPGRVVATAVIFVIASLIPVVRGVKIDSISNGIWTPTAELVNGRVAMVGYAALLISEILKGGAYFH